MGKKKQKLEMVNFEIDYKIIILYLNKNRRLHKKRQMQQDT